MPARLLLAVLSLVALAFAQKKPLTLDAVTGAGHRHDSGGEPVWRPDGKAFVHEKDSSVFLYDLATKSDKELLSLSPLEQAARHGAPPRQFQWENRNVHEQPLQWSPPGDALLILAGGDLFYWHVSSGKWDQLTETPEPEQDPKLAPDGKTVAFRRSHDLYTLDLASHRETRLTSNGSSTLRNGELDWVYPEELELPTAYWWAPDSQSLAYLQFDVSREPLYPHEDLLGASPIYEPQRYPRAGDPNADVRLGVVQASGGATRWFDLGDTRDANLLARVQWMPGSHSLAVERLNRVQNHLELLSVDVYTGEIRRILEERDPYWINVTDDFRFLKKGNEFLWSSERDGFRHLYLYEIGGKESRRLTRGDWEVTEVAGVDETQGIVYYVSSESSPLERQLYSVRLNGKGQKRLSVEPGTHSISMNPNCDYYLDTFSSLDQPPRRTLYTRDGAEWAVYRAPDRHLLDEYEVPRSELLAFRASDGVTLDARIIKPPGFRADRKYPAIVLVYGGPGAQAVRDAWQGVGQEQYWASRGFVVWEVDNRGSSGRGHAFESAVFRKLGPRELEDQKQGVEYLISLGFVDPARIGIHGWSYGGFMTLNCVLNAPSLFRAAIAGAPVTDWHNYDTIYTERYMGLPSQNVDGYRETALAPHAGELNAKLLLVLNLEDDNVLFQNTMQMANALEKAGKEFEMVLYPQKSHGVGGPLRRQLLETMTDFFERTLK